jgi:1-acyl-sn-glycerol-3-phosphate acyltransferase
MYRIIIALALGCCRLLRWDMRTAGLQHIPEDGPAIIASNHVGYLDFVFLGVAAWRRRRLVRFMALREAFQHRVFGPILRGLHHIPVDRSGDAAASLDLAVQVLRHGEVVGLHPEGKVSKSFVTMPGKSGAVRLAIETGAPLIPAAVWGSQRILAPGRRPRFPRRVAIVTTFGPPVQISSDADPAEATLALMERIGRLVDETAAAYPQRPRGPDDTWWLPNGDAGGAPPSSGSSAKAEPGA